MNERVLTLYERTGCTLCEDMVAAVQRQLVASNVVLCRVNIDVDAALKGKFDWEVPLLFAGDIEICRHELDTKALNGWLGFA